MVITFPTPKFSILDLLGRVAVSAAERRLFYEGLRPDFSRTEELAVRVFTDIKKEASE